MSYLFELNKNNLQRLKIRQDTSGIKWGWDIEGVLKKNGFSDNIIDSNIFGKVGLVYLIRIF